MRLAINASRARSGGAKTHLVNFISALSPKFHGFNQVHVWTYDELSVSLPNPAWLIKHTPFKLKTSILYQLWWERTQLSRALIDNGCNILLNIDASTVCRFLPAITMSRDMLSYESGEMYRNGFSKSTLRLLIIKYLQNASLRSSSGVVFLTRYAGRIIQESSGVLPNVSYIPHGVSETFRINPFIRRDYDYGTDYNIECLYVSDIAPYKHQWHVVRAIKILRDQGIKLKLTLTGGGNADGFTASHNRLKKEISSSDPEHSYITRLGYIDHEILPSVLKKADIFIFASSCENMPNTLIEAMATGLPIACSNRGPMPEVLKDAGVFFNPEKAIEISSAIKKLIKNKNLRNSLALKAKSLSSEYSWKKCADETLKFIAETLLKSNK